MAQVVLENIYKSFAQHQRRQATAQVDPDELAPKGSGQTVPVLRNINLIVNDGEFMVLVGASGCGKSTLLRLLAGLETVTAGTMLVGDRRVNDLPPKERNIAMVFQNYALYPHMTVYDNLAFGLRRTGGATPPDRQGQASRSSLGAKADAILAAATRKLPKALRYWSAQERRIDQQVRSVARMLQIEELLHRLPKQLSGGQKQRVALGRAMARNPDVFLMDEPLSNLDAKLRAETRAQIVALQRQLGITTLYVTHDQIEAMTMGDRIAVVHAGQIQQIASPLELYNRPANQYVAGFIGSPPMNFLAVQVVTPTQLHYAHGHITLPEPWAAVLASYVGQAVTLGIRPEHLSLHQPGADQAGSSVFEVTIDRIEALGNETYLSVSSDSISSDTMDAKQHGDTSLLQVRIRPDIEVHLGDTVMLIPDINHIHLFDPATGLAIVPLQA